MLREFGEFLLPLIFCITYTIMKTCYPGEPVNIHIQSLFNIIYENNWVIAIKRVRVNYHYFVLTGTG